MMKLGERLTRRQYVPAEINHKSPRRVACVEKSWRRRVFIVSWHFVAAGRGGDKR